MNNQRASVSFSILLILLIVTVVGLTYANYQYSVQNPGGNDFLSRYVGTRIFLMEGVSPYSNQATLAIHELMYGRAAEKDEDQVLFVYPMYVIYLMAPFALIKDYFFARAIWMTVLELSVVALVWISLSLSRWKISTSMLSVFIFFSVFWYHSVRPIVNGNPAVLVALMIGLALLAIRSGNDGLAGFLLAFATIKPQMLILLVVYVLFWSITRRRWHIFWGFISTLAFFIATTLILMPDWIMQNLRQLVAYPGYTLPSTPGAILKLAVPGVGNQLGWAITIIMISALIVEWRASANKDFHWFLWTAMLTLVATNLIGIPTATENYIALYPALVLVFSAWGMYWKKNGKLLITFSMGLLFFGLWWLFISTLEPGDQPIQNPVMFFPLPVFLFLTLYWVRWWVLRPAQPFMEQFRSLDRGRKPG